jgi:hypothetical protein
MDRPEFYRFHQGDKTLPFAPGEYDARLALLRKDMESQGVTACLLTSMHNIAYYSGFIYCTFGRPYGWWSPPRTACHQRRHRRGAALAPGHGDAITYTDWARDNYWRAVRLGHRDRRWHRLRGRSPDARAEGKLDAFLSPQRTVDIAPATMRAGCTNPRRDRADPGRGRDGGCGRLRHPRCHRRRRARDRRGHGRARRDGTGDRAPLPRGRVPRHLGLVPVGHQHRRRPQPGDGRAGCNAAIS